MFNLPPELVLETLAYLPISALAPIQQVSRNWYKFIRFHESLIFYKAALLHGYVHQTVSSLEKASAAYSCKSIGHVASWKDLCRKRYCIQKSWSGKGPSKIKSHPKAGRCVHRIKVDEQAGYILTTSYWGGLSVTDLQRDQELWSLPDSHVRPYAHCEYDKGFVIFDYIDGSKEVWRRVDDYHDDEAASVIPESRPVARQSRAYTAAAEKYQTASTTSTRGHFRPWALLRPPQLTRAFRFCYPVLGAVGRSKIFLWDVRTGTLVQTFEEIRLDSSDTEGEGPTLLEEINYIEVSPKYVFICGDASLLVFSRKAGKCVLEIPSRYPLATWQFSIIPNRTSGETQGASLMLEKHESRRASFSHERTIVDTFVAAHISPCGRHLAVLLSSSKLLLIRDFEKMFASIPSCELSVEIQLGSPCYSSRYLAYENGRIGVVTKTGVFVVQPRWTEAHVDAPPDLLISRIPALGNRQSLAFVTCLQMTDTGLFLNWDMGKLTQDDYSIMETRFHQALSDEPHFFNLENDTYAPLLDFQEQETVTELSNVVSVDFSAPQT